MISPIGDPKLPFGVLCQVNPKVISSNLVFRLCPVIWLNLVRVARAHAQISLQPSLSCRSALVWAEHIPTVASLSRQINVLKETQGTKVTRQSAEN